MKDTLYISPLAEISRVGEDKVALSVVGRRYTVEDPAGLIRRILAHAEQGLDLERLAGDLPEHVPLSAVEATVKALADTRVLVPRNTRECGDATQHHLAHRRELDGNFSPTADYDPAGWLVPLAGRGSLAGALAAALAAMDVPVVALADDAALPDVAGKRALVVTCSDQDAPFLPRDVNRRCVAANLPSLHVAIDWTAVHCGPLVLPRATACYECYHHRVRATRRFVAEFDERGAPGNILYPAVPSRLAVQWAVAEASRLVLKYLSGNLERIHQSVFTEIDTLSGDVRRSAVLRLPRCPVCGGANAARPVGSVFQHAQLRRKG